MVEPADRSGRSKVAPKVAAFAGLVKGVLHLREDVANALLSHPRRWSMKLLDRNRRSEGIGRPTPNWTGCRWLPEVVELRFAKAMVVIGIAPHDIARGIDSINRLPTKHDFRVCRALAAGVCA